MYAEGKSRVGCCGVMQQKQGTHLYVSKTGNSTERTSPNGPCIMDGKLKFQFSVLGEVLTIRERWETGGRQ